MSSEYREFPAIKLMFELKKYICSHFKTLEIISEIEQIQKNQRLNDLFYDVKNQKISFISIEGTDLTDDTFYVVLENGKKLLVQKVQD